MSGSEDAALLDRQTEARLKEIEATVKEQALTSARRPMTSLRDLYESNDDSGGGANGGGAATNFFLEGCAYLTRHYTDFRSIRGDGNCYYRAFLYRLTEVLRDAKPDKNDEGLRILEWIKTTSWQQVLAAGYSEFAVETFYDEVVELLQDAVVDRSKSADEWHSALNQENAASDYCTWYLRVLTATYLKADPNRFLPFMEEQHLDMAQYCQREGTLSCWREWHSFQASYIHPHYTLCYNSRTHGKGMRNGQCACLGRSLWSASIRRIPRWTCPSQ